MFLFLSRVLFELFLRSLARKPRRRNRVHGVTKHAHNLRGEDALQNLDRLLHIRLVSRRHRALRQTRSRARPQLLYIG